MEIDLRFFNYHCFCLLQMVSEVGYIQNENIRLGAFLVGYYFVRPISYLLVGNQGSRPLNECPLSQFVSRALVHPRLFLNKHHDWCDKNYTSGRKTKKNFGNTALSKCLS